MTPRQAPFRHEAVFYGGLDDFVGKIAPFIVEGAEAFEPALVVVSAAKIDRLRDALGGTPDGVTFADMSNVGENPARIIPAWRDFVDRHTGAERRFRGVGEPIWAERAADELVECQHHESLLNVAFADTNAFWLVCPYDTTTLPNAVLDEAARSHEYVSNGRAVGLSKTYSGLASFAQPFSAALPDPPTGAEVLPVSVDTLQHLRELVARHARAAGFDTTQVADLVFVANEIATNSVVHARGTGVFTIWRDNDAVVCQSGDTGRIDHALAGRERPASGQESGQGLWLANQLCDLVQIRTFADGSVVRVRMSRRG